MASCERTPEGFSEIDEGVYERLCAFGEGELAVEKSYLSTLSVYTAQRLSSHFDYMSQIDLDPIEAFEGAPRFVRDKIAALKEGDSLCWKLPYEKIKGSFLDEYSTDGIVVADTAEITLVVSVNGAWTKSAYFESDRYKRLQRSIQEDQRISEVIRSAGLEDSVVKYGPLRYRILREGSGETPKSGEDLVLGYEGYFLDSTQFDLAADSTTWLYFPYGKPDQVIEGIEMQIGHMREGEVREVYMPSSLAFGERGSKQIVPPNTPVRFVLELVEISSVNVEK